MNTRNMEMTTPSPRESAPASIDPMMQINEKKQAEIAENLTTVLTALWEKKSITRSRKQKIDSRITYARGIFF
jgi:hypothetical protein